jgi:hypothetical protein
VSIVLELAAAADPLTTLALDIQLRDPMSAGQEWEFHRRAECAATI